MDWVALALSFRLAAIARRTDLEAPDLAPEPARQRNVTMIPRDGGRVIVRAKHPG